ncbi:MAG TPA: EAL domain-containing protein [Stenomitos sp.]
MTEKSAGSCPRCELPPKRVEGAGGLYLWFPLDHIFQKAQSFLQQAGHEHELLVAEQCMLLRLVEGELSKAMAGLGGLLTLEEQRDTQALFMRGHAQPMLADFGRVTSLFQFITMVRSGWLIDLIGEERLTTHFQPIVSAADTARIYAHEALMRGIEPDGSLVYPPKILNLARDAGMLFQLDLLARLTAVRQAHRHGIPQRVFINFNPAAIYDPTHCLRSTIQAVDEAGIPRENIVFEIVESDHTQDLNHLKAIIAYYREQGFQVALDDLGAGYSSLNLLHQLRPDFVKLDMELVRNVHLDPYKGLITRKILEIAQHLGIQTVAEGVEYVEELEWLREHGADFVQGYLVAKPTTPPVLQTPSFGLRTGDPV